jgi:hypothetical protein
MLAYSQREYPTMRGARVKALKRAFIARYDRAPRKTDHARGVRSEWRLVKKLFKKTMGNP